MSNNKKGNTTHDTGADKKRGERAAMVSPREKPEDKPPKPRERKPGNGKE